jgi:superfamily II DNA or RNA helicase
MNQLFQNFKKVKSFHEFKQSGVKVFFKLDFDSGGAFLEVVNEKGKPVEVSYQEYSGTTRNVLRSLGQISTQQDFMIDWENPEAQTYLHEHDYLLELLRHADNLIDSKSEKIVFNAETSKTKLLLEHIQEDKIKSSLLLITAAGIVDDFVFLNESFVFYEGKIAEIEPVGVHFNNILFFDTEFHSNEIDKFLTLFYSYFDGVEISYEGHTFEQSTEKIIAEPCLFFEKVDADNSLHLRVGQSLPRLGNDFLDQYEIYRLAEVNELERKVIIRNIDQQPTEIYVNKIEKLISKHAKIAKNKLNQVVLEGETFIIPHDIAGQFIYNELPNLLTEFKIFGAEKLKTYKISTTMPKLDVKMGSGIDFLEGDVSLDFGTDKISLFDAISQYQKNRYILLSDGSHALMNESYMDKLQRLFKKKKEKAHLSFFDLPLIEELLDEKLMESQFKQSRKFFTGLNDLSTQKFKQPKDVNAELRPYQQQGVKWLNYLQENKFGGCLADDMGLGKTLQTITMLASIYPKESLSSIIVMPKSLLFNWENEVKKFAPQISTYTYYDKQRVIKEALKHNLIFTTYAMLRNDIEEFKEIKFHYAILDESQNIKNIQSQTTKAAFLINANHRLALSGTPIENNLGELYSLFRYLNPSMFGTPENFNQTYLMPIQKNNDIDITQELRKKIYPFILRRLKKDVLKELPDKIENTLYVEMSDEQKKLYEKRRLFYKAAIDAQIAEKGVSQSQFYIFQALNELRQIASIPESRSDGNIASPKLEFLMEQMQEAIANGHKVLVFVNYLQAIELIGEALDNQGIDYVSMSGSTKDRQRLVDRFQRDPDCKAFIMTLKTGGTGLNLTAADMVFIFDPWWNKAAESQAIDRSHRIGQSKTVFSYKMITKDSIEEKIILLQQQKADLFNSIISADSASLKSFTESDIKFILGK